MKTTLVLAVTALSMSFAAAQNAQKFGSARAAETFVNYRSDVFIATARVGDAAKCDPSPSVWELGLQTQYNQPSLVKRNYNWQNGKTVQWSLNYNASTRQVSFRVAGEVLNYTLGNDKQVSGLIVSAFAPNCASIKIDNMILNQSNIALGVSARDCGKDFLAIRGLSSNVALSGTVVMKWHGEPKSNELGMTIRGTEAVPEPASMIALALGVAAMVRRKRAAKAK